MEIPGNKPSPPRRAGTLGETLKSAASSTYFTKRSAVYFYCISTLFLLYTLFYFRIKFNIPRLVSPVSFTSITK
jgi:hypothetical protein